TGTLTPRSRSITTDPRSITASASKRRSMNKLKKPSVAATAPRDADAPRTPPTKNAAESKNHLFRVPLTVGGMVIAIDIPQGDQLDDHPATSAPTRTA